MNRPTQIHADTPLHLIIATVPNTLPIFHNFGMDSCCGGHLPLATAVERHGLSLETVLAALRNVEQRG